MEKKESNRWNPGMSSDSEPQPKQDPDFGPGMEYESGDRQDEEQTAEKIRKQWQKTKNEAA